MINYLNKQFFIIPHLFSQEKKNDDEEENRADHKAFDYYLRGLKLVENRSDLFEVYRTLSWELSNSYFSMAISLQDHAPLSTMSQEDVRKKKLQSLD